ncbi:MAG: 1,4-dihydroxy-2-naphthoate octaprenyltransferase [Bacteroidia bacterium]|nr:1,4-dihydroxy-2-naphthoate octaprenyltransferase [Bacteroidia bacterium]
MFKAFIQAARLRTLPLCVSGIIVGCSLSNFCIYDHSNGLLTLLPNCIYDYTIFTLALLTTIGLQVLSNFANDYGDGVKGTDANRQGEKRLVASGIISAQHMKKAVVITAIITFLLALALIYVAFKNDFIYAIVFVVLGVASIAAAVKYTVGKKAYGYSGLGDLFVFLFFGLLSTVGSYFLYTKALNFDIFLPATTIGLLSAAVLNLNNMRDRIEDIKHNKITLAVKLGSQGSKIYHFSLIIFALICASVYVNLNYYRPTQYVFLIAFIPLLINMVVVGKNIIHKELDSELKKVALSTFLFAILFSIFN